MARIAVFGAGAIGCWIGGRLAAGGAEVTLIGRARVLDFGGTLRVTDLDGGDTTATVAIAIDDPAAARGADVVLVTTKSAATAEAGRALAGAGIGRETVVVSMQNGVRNVDALRAALPEHRVLAGMVPWNVVKAAPGVYHRASAGTLAVERGAPALVHAARAADLPLAEHADLAPIQWAKLVMNLNNAVNALSDLPLREELSRRDYRRCLAAAQREALTLLAMARQPVARLTAVPPRWMPRLLELPDALFARLAKQVLAIDPAARSSMWDDMVAGRPTEIGELQGEIMRLAARVGGGAPVNAKIAALVERGRRGWDAAALWAEVRPPRSSPRRRRRWP